MERFVLFSATTGNLTVLAKAFNTRVVERIVLEP